MLPMMAGYLMAGGAAPGWWVVDGKTCVMAYQAIGAASLAASYVNLANPGTYDAAPGSAPSFNAATGWTFDGIANYLTTGITPAGDNSWSMLVRFSDGATDGNRFVAGTNVQRNFHLAPVQAGANRQYAQPTKYLRVAGGKITSGVMAIAGVTAYLNGASDGTLATNVADGTANTIFIGAANATAGANSFFSGNVLAVVIYSDTLSGAEVATVSAAMAALT